MTEKRVTYKLYELSDAVTQLNDLIENLDGVEIPADLHEEYLSILEEAQQTKDKFLEKIDSIVSLIQSRKRWLAVRKLESKRLQKLVKKDEKTIEWLTTYLIKHLDKQQLKKLRTNKFNLNLRQASCPPLILRENNPKNYPQKYQKITVEIDKKLLKEDLKNGDSELLKYANLGEKSTYLSIK